MVKKVAGLSYCGNQLGHLMGLRCHVSPQDSRNCPALSRRPETCMSNPYPHHFNRYGKAFTDRLFGVRRRAATRQHAFETLCSTLGIEYRLIPPRGLQTNGMVERFNGPIEDVLQRQPVGSGDKLGTTLHRYVWLYNHPLAQSTLGSRTPLQAMKQRHKRKPKLFTT